MELMFNDLILWFIWSGFGQHGPHKFIDYAVLQFSFNHAVHIRAALILPNILDASHPVDPGYSIQAKFPTNTAPRP